MLTMNLCGLESRLRCRVPHVHVKLSLQKGLKQIQAEL